MITPPENRNLQRVTVTLDPIDVDLLDRLGALEGRNRSEELRSLLAELRPMLRQTIEAFEAAARARDALEAAVRESTVSELESIRPDIERFQDLFMGALARLEGQAAAAAAADDPRPSSHGGHTPQPRLPEGR